MIGPDDIGERRPANHTPTIALSIAAVLLFIVGALSYRDFVRSSLEKEFAEKEARLMQRNGYVPAATGQIYPQGAAPQPNLQSSPTAGGTEASPGFGYKAPTGTVLYDAQGNPVYVAGAPTYPQAAGQQTETSLPEPEDPDISKMRDSLDLARQQGQLTEQRFNNLAGNVDPLAREAAAVEDAGVGAATGTAAITSELPDFLRNAVENPPGGNPEVEARLDRMRAQVMAAPSLAKVTSFDKDWGIVTFNAGAVQGVKVDQRFAVRRGGDILGWVKVDQVDDQQSIAVLVTKNRDSDTAVKPDVGDDLIDFELF